MKNRVFFLLSLCFLLGACNNNETNTTPSPDISAIELPLQVQRFDRDLFVIDTNNMTKSLRGLKAKYAGFLNTFLYNIVALSPQKKNLDAELKVFLQQHQALYTAAQRRLQSLTPEIKQITAALKRAKYYFPKAQMPGALILYVGPLDGYGSITTQDKIAIGLQHYLGADYEGYGSSYLSNIFPAPVIKRFAKEYMAADVLNHWLQNSLVPHRSTETLIERMVEEGKRLYVLKRLLPQAADTIILGYSAQELAWCKGHEQAIWSYFSSKKLWNNHKPETILAYTSDYALPPREKTNFPVNIGKYIGWTMLHKWREVHPKDDLQTLIASPAKDIVAAVGERP